MFVGFNTLYGRHFFATHSYQNTLTRFVGWASVEIVTFVKSESTSQSHHFPTSLLLKHLCAT